MPGQAVTRLSINSLHSPQQGQMGPGYAETKYSAQQSFSQTTAQTPPSSGASGYGGPGGSGGFGDVLNRYKLEQTIRQLHSFSTTSDPRSSFGAPFSGV